MKWLPLKLLGVALVVSTVLNARTPQIAYASNNDLFQSTSTVAYFISNMAKIYGVDSKMALFISSHESRFQADAVGDFGQSFGIWQIHLIDHNKKSSHPISKAEALDVVSSTIWAMEELQDGHQNIWSTWHYRRSLFPDDLLVLK